MVLLKINIVIMFFTALSHKISSAPPKRDQPSTSSAPFPLDEPKNQSGHYIFLEGNFMK